jgi:acetate---CoA ligase (ADP-forming)
VSAIDRLVSPKKVAVLGASAKRVALGNVTILNLKAAGYRGTILPIHAEAGMIEGLQTVATIEDLPADVDVAVVSVPAAATAEAVTRLDRAGIASAIIMSNGFSPFDERALKRSMAEATMLAHGPNCMGLINLTDGIPLYTGSLPRGLRSGRIALIAQSGSAAISVINATRAGFSKILTVGSEFALSTAEYVEWLAGDAATEVVGVVLESIWNPDRFAAAVGKLAGAGKSLVVLKVGRSEAGARAAYAHTGALIKASDAYDRFLRQLDMPTVSDYEQLVATLETFEKCGSRSRGGKTAIVGISGGETALACDVASEVGLELAVWSESTAEEVRTILPGTTGLNPVDQGASIGERGTRLGYEAMRAILDDPAVEAMAIIQDMQATLPPRSLEYYTGQVRQVQDAAAKTSKPVVVISPTGDPLHPEFLSANQASDVPLLRGMRAGLAAVRNLALHPRPALQQTASAAVRVLTPEAAELRESVRGLVGPIPLSLAERILGCYGIPVAQSAKCSSAKDAIPAAQRIGYPLVVKVISSQISHRSEVGGVRLGIGNEHDLIEAIDAIQRDVSTARLDALIDGFELQEQLQNCVEVMAGYAAVQPFNPLIVVGTGGTLVELQGDRASELSPVTASRAEEMIRSTRVGKLLGGYRNLISETPLAELASTVSNLSRLAVDFDGIIAECDLNPLLVEPKTGKVRVVDALLVATGD